MKKSRKVSALRAIAVASVLALGLAACGSSGSSGSQSVAKSVGATGKDDGATLTLWTRAPLEKQAKLLVQAYNSSHKNQVKLTIVPNDDYVAKVGAAAGSGGLPDLFASDIVYVPNFVHDGLFRDISAQYNALSYKDQINQGHVSAGTVDGKEHVLPFVLDLSVMMWNKDLYKKAGLNPDKGPSTLQQFDAQAKAVNKLGGGVHGSYFGGNCGGCLVFTWFPSVWAAGGNVMNAAGTSANLASPPATDVYKVWKDLVDANALAPGYKDETGATWVAPFQSGKVGVMPYPATLLSTADQSVNVGVGAIPGPNGGESTFVGGDGIGISKDSKHEAESWNFLSWLLSKQAQVDVLAKDGDVTSRADFASNKYSKKDPRVVQINQIASHGKTPIALHFQEAYNAPNSPWLSLVRNAVFGDGSQVSKDNDEISSVLGQ